VTSSSTLCNRIMDRTGVQEATVVREVLPNAEEHCQWLRRSSWVRAYDGIGLTQSLLGSNNLWHAWYNI
jgi:hypothetical protein